MKKRVQVNHPILQGNQQIADRNREYIKQQQTISLNLISSPGAGKTTFLEQTIRLLSGERMGVIEGDVATTLDAERISRTGAEVIQINTHGACHLDARMISQVLNNLNLSQLDFLIIENVGNLVCPVEFDLGENFRLTLISTAEGSDKILKYPTAFQLADAVILNKIDLLPYLTFNLSHFYEAMDQVNPNIPVFQVSALTGEGMEQWTRWLLSKKKVQ